MSASTQAAKRTTEGAVYKRERPHYSDFEGHNGECASCGLATFNAPDIHDVHLIRMQYETEAGEGYCEACFFNESHDRTGSKIVHPSEYVSLYEAYVQDERGVREYYYFENHQAAAGFARRNEDAEYRGERTIDRRKLTRID